MVFAYVLFNFFKSKSTIRYRWDKTLIYFAARDAQSRIIAYSRIILKFISESRISNPILEFSTRFFLLLFLLKISLIKITAVKNCNEEH